MSDRIKVIDGIAMDFDQYVEYLKPITGDGRAHEVAALEYGLGGDTVIIDEQGHAQVDWADSDPNERQ